MNIVEELIGELTIGSARGRKGAPLEVFVLRELDEEDLPAILAPKPHGATTPALQDLREHHHLLARLLAEGKTQADAAAIMGYSQSRVSILLDDPTFAELLAYYKQQVHENYLGVHERLGLVTGLAVDELRTRLEENPSGFSRKELLDVIETAGDRSVAPSKGVQGGSPAPASAPTLIVQFVDSPTPQVGTLIEAKAKPRGEEDD